MKDESRFIERIWQRRGLGAVVRPALLPLSALFGAAVRTRSALYRWRIRRGRELPAAVVSVGNLSVGGTGKTPTALWVADELTRRGYRVAILSRGYGGTVRTPTLVGTEARDGLPATDDWREIGDEAVLLARRFGGPVVVSRRRAEAGRKACEELGADVLVLDDGFQHLRLARDFDLVLVRSGSFTRPGVLPAGPFREPPSALRRADAVLVTKREGEDLRTEGVPGKLPVFHGALRPRSLVTVVGGEWREVEMGRLAGQRSVAVSGIADRDSFYWSLRGWGARPEDFLEFPDHHVYTLDDWKRIAHRSRGYELVVTTEKDLVKLSEYPFAKGKLVALRVVMEVENGETLIEQIVEAVRKKRSAVSCQPSATSKSRDVMVSGAGSW